MCNPFLAAFLKSGFLVGAGALCYNALACFPSRHARPVMVDSFFTRGANEMRDPQIRKFGASLALVVVLLCSGIIPTSQARADSILPNIHVTLISGNSTYAATVYADQELTFQAQVKNIGNVPLQVVANLTIPPNWVEEEEKYSECDDISLEVRKTCTTTWKFTPEAAGQVYLRVYVRAYYEDANGNTDRITQSPAFIFNVQPARQGTSEASETSATTSTTSTTSSSSTVTGTLPNMSVTLISGNSTYASTVYADRELTFQAQVKNIGNVPLQVVANLTIPTNWVEDEEKYSECDDIWLEVRKTCTITWKFTPEAAGQVYLRVYVRGYYDTSSGGTDRITRSPAFIFNVKPPKTSD